MSYGVGHRHGLDPSMLWLWCRPAAVAPIPPLAWELPYALGVALKSQKKKKKSITLKKITLLPVKSHWVSKIGVVFRNCLSKDCCILVFVLFIQRAQS